MTERLLAVAGMVLATVGLAGVLACGRRSGVLLARHDPDLLAAGARLVAERQASARLVLVAVLLLATPTAIPPLRGKLAAS